MKTQAIPVQVTTRTRRETRDRPHEWTVIVEVLDSSKRGGVEIEAGQVYQHIDGPIDDPHRIGYEARMSFGPYDFEVRAEDHGVARTPGLGIATKGEAVTALVREFTFEALADLFHEHGPSD